MPGHTQAVLLEQSRQMPEPAHACFRVTSPSNGPIQPAWRQEPVLPPPATAVTALTQLQNFPGRAATAVPQSTRAVAELTIAFPPEPREQLQNASALQHGKGAALRRAKPHTVGFGLPPIPGHSPQVTWSPDKGGKVATHARTVAHPGRKLSDPMAAKKNSKPPAHGRLPSSRVKKETPGWNSDFSVQYQNPMSIKDQERVIRHMTQGRTPQPSRSATIRARQPSAAGDRSDAKGKDGWPELQKFMQHPGSAQVLHGSSQPQLASAACQCAVASQPNKIVDVEEDSSWLNQKDEQRQLAGWAGKRQLPGGRPAYIRNLDSAQSPLRPYKGKESGGYDPRELHNGHDFCFLPIKVCGCTICRFSTSVSSTSAFIM